MPGFAGHGTPHPSGVRERAARRCGTRRQARPAFLSPKGDILPTASAVPRPASAGRRLPASKTRRARSFAAPRRRSAASRRQPASKPTRRRTLLKNFSAKNPKICDFWILGGRGSRAQIRGRKKIPVHPKMGVRQICTGIFLRFHSSALKYTIF